MEPAEVDGSRGEVKLIPRSKEGRSMNIILAIPESVAGAVEGLKEFEESLAPLSYQLLFLDTDKPLKDQVGQVEVIIPAVSSVSQEVIDAAPNLQLIHQFGVGLDTVDIPAATKRGVYVANVPDTSDVAQAEFAMLLMLAVSKKVLEARDLMGQGVFFLPIGSELAGKTLGLIGYGRSARQLAPRAKAFGMQVLTVEKFHEGVSDPHLDFIGGVNDLDYVLSNSDFVSLHVPANEETNEMMDKNRLSLMRRTAFLINVARASIVVKEDLIKALQSGTIAGAGLDVFWNEPEDPRDEILSMKNVVATPHVATATRECRINTGIRVAENIKLVAGGKKPIHCVNL
jgi:D-3-phosphoglycerate dehydrogenase